VSAPLLPRKPIPPRPPGMGGHGDVELFEPEWLFRYPRRKPLVAVTQADSLLLEILARGGWTAREALAGRRASDAGRALAYLSPELRYGLSCYVAGGIGDIPLLRVLRRLGPDPVVDAVTLVTSIQVVAAASAALGITTIDGLKAVERALLKMQETEAAA
jgi:hypothetical protein